MTGLGIAIFLACVVGFCIALLSLLDVGTCASGNQPYVIAQECPDGTEAKALLLVLSILGLFVAIGVFLLRGRPPGGWMKLSAMPVLAGWAIFFTASGAVALIHSLTSETIPDDGRLGGEIVGVIFLIMGLPVLAFCLWRVVRRFGNRDERPAGFDDPGIG
jgi:hypothetical protein